MKKTFDTYITVIIGVISIYIFAILFSILTHLFLKGSFITGIITGSLAFFFGSLVIGYKIRYRAWFYGAIAGLILSILLLLLNFLSLLSPSAIHGIPQSGISHITMQTIIKNVTMLPFNVFLASLGGLAGERFLTKKDRA